MHQTGVLTHHCYKCKLDEHQEKLGTGLIGVYPLRHAHSNNFFIAQWSFFHAVVTVVFLLFKKEVQSSSVISSVSFDTPTNLANSLMVCLILDFLSDESLYLRESRKAIYNSVTV